MNLLTLAQRWLRRRLLREGVVSRETEVRGLLVHHYYLKGSGPSASPPVVLVHGLGGSANGFARTLKGLAERFPEVYAVDFPGNGFSPLPAGGPLSLEGLLGVLDGFMEEVVKKPAYVIGNSLGGALALGLATRFPSHVRALGLVAPAGARVSEEKLQALLSSFRITSAAEARSLTRRLFHRAPWVLVLFGPQLCSLYASPAVQAVRTTTTAADSLSPEQLASLKVPTLLLWGGSEKLLPFEGVEYFRAHLPRHARIEVVDGFGHVPQMERPRELVQRLTAFADEAQL